MASSPEPTVLIESGDGLVLRVETKIAFRCQAVKRRWENGQMENGVILFNNVSGPAMIRVLNYCKLEWRDDFGNFVPAYIKRRQGINEPYPAPPSKPIQLVHEIAPDDGSISIVSLSGSGASSDPNKTSTASSLGFVTSSLHPFGEFSGLGDQNLSVMPYQDVPFSSYISHVNPAVLCELASASYYLDVKPLVDLTCRAIADTIKGKSPEEIRSTFNIVNDFSPVEEEQVRRSVLERTLLLPTNPDESDACNINKQVPLCGAFPNNSVTRAKLRNKLIAKSVKTTDAYFNDKDKGEARSLDDIMKFIEPSKSKARKKKKKKAKKGGKKENNDDGEGSDEGVGETPTNENVEISLPQTHMISDSQSSKQPMLISEHVAVSSSSRLANTRAEEYFPEEEDENDDEVERFRLLLEGINADLPEREQTKQKLAPAIVSEIKTKFTPLVQSLVNKEMQINESVIGASLSNVFLRSTENQPDEVNARSADNILDECISTRAAHHSELHCTGSAGSDRFVGLPAGQPASNQQFNQNTSEVSGMSGVHSPRYPPSPFQPQPNILHVPILPSLLSSSSSHENSTYSSPIPHLLEQHFAENNSASISTKARESLSTLESPSSESSANITGYAHDSVAHVNVPYLVSCQHCREWKSRCDALENKISSMEIRFRALELVYINQMNGSTQLNLLQSAGGLMKIGESDVEQRLQLLESQCRSTIGLDFKNSIELRLSLLEKFYSASLNNNNTCASPPAPV